MRSRHRLARLTPALDALNPQRRPLQYRLHERVEKRTYWADEAFNLTLQGNPRTGNSNELAKAKFDEIMALPEHERETAYRAMKGSKKQELPNDRSMSTGVNSIKIEPPAGQGGCCTIA